MASQTVENYIKTIYLLTEMDGASATTSALSEKLDTTAASVTDMLKKLAEQNLIKYIKYKGVKLNQDGKNMALQLIRKHRIWETFLHEKLNISWDSIHDIAEQLEHVKSDILIDKLDTMLNYPKYDPHGDPIPDASGKLTYRLQKPLNQSLSGEKLRIVGVKDHKPNFLKYLDSIPLAIDQVIEVKEIIEFDHSIQIKVDQENVWTLSEQAAENILVKNI
ncbi:MAG: metal-dependent transcriptional regulator [Saprospiraceae bacterium]